MKISVITVVYNDLEGLKKTVSSVLSQTCKDFEYVILDGGSTDGCVEYIKSLDFRGVKKSEPDKGIYNAMNKAIKMANGDYCLFLNAGDTFYDEQVLENADKKIGIADIYVGSTVEIGERIQRFLAPYPMTVGHLLKTSIYHQSTFTRRTLLLQHPYNEQHKIVSDWEFFFERWLAGCSYEKLDFFVANYYLGGFSYEHRDLIDIERQEVIDRLIPPRVREYYESEIIAKENVLRRDIHNNNPQTKVVKSKLEKKLEIAMTQPPVARDLKILRNAFKALLKDIFV